ncbi:DNA mismatch repair protein MutS [Halobium salinum]|uniref:DNA mismatch repair protein MutS n=1 Tax=Halobium salinum TaxID=1364940 RepID=A0ABD5PCB1_9EURY|nr:DNA mismatch repair protein MutS [Halobium salinum]
MPSESALGPPPSMTEVRDELTPMLSQYYELCERYDDALVLFQVGDFYEAFCEAAEVVARTCEVTLTKREDSTGTYPMAGLPIDNAASYLDRLLDAGYRVAVADQVEDAEEASGLVDRAVTRIVTPGTLTDDELLGAADANYVAAVARGDGSDVGTGGAGGASDADGPYALAAVDVSTGECLVTSLPDAERCVEELERLAPAELLLGPGVDLPDDRSLPAMESAHDPDAFGFDAARERVGAYVPSPDAVLDAEVEVRACGAVLAYAEYTQGDERLEYVSRITRYDPRESLRLDATALRSLELFETRGDSRGRPLVDVVDDTASAPGRRRLRAWLRRPLLDRERIEARHGAVAELVERSLLRERLRELLAEVYDVERLVGRVSRGRANARDLRSLLTTLDTVPELRAALEGSSDTVGDDADHVASDHLCDLLDALDTLDDVRDLLRSAIAEEPPMEVTEGGVIREGFDADLDDLRATEREGRQWVADLEASERERTGIDSLEVGHNQVHGYYIEVTNPNLDRVPDDYTRRQTLKNSERFYTPELKRREDEIFGAAERADSLEYDLFVEVRERVAAETDRIQRLADAVADLDALASFAAVAVANDYVCPEFGSHDEGIHIENGRHPVVERTRREFVPNDARLGGRHSEDGERGRIAVVTGPNMSGKSTYMRQVALVVVLAQAGSFVPADAARLPILDRVFTRVGASDDIAGGQSTFMREMSELTDILHDATDESLVLLDEVGRGTSTADGRAIARATTEFLAEAVGAYTLFATHYHELTDLAEDLDSVFNLHFAASRDPESDGESVTFLHRVREGAADSSYGVEVAELAGVPERVVSRSRALVDAERDGADDVNGADGADEATETQAASRQPAADSRQRTLADAAATNGGAHVETEPVVEGAETDDGVDADVLADLADLDLARTTPLEALNALHDLQRRLEGAEDGG